MRHFLLFLALLIAVPVAADTQAALSNALKAQNVVLEDWEGALRLKSLSGETITQDNLDRIGELVASVDGIEGLWFNKSTFTDLSPLADHKIRRFWLSSTNPNLSDLSPLKGMPLEAVGIEYSPIESLDPLRDMPLKVLRVNKFTGDKLEPIAGMDLEVLSLMWAENITDLTPIKGMPLRTLWLNGATGITDLSPIAGMPLESLRVAELPVTNIDAVRGMNLSSLVMDGMPNIVSLDPLRGMSLRRFDLSYVDVPLDLSPLKDVQMESLILIESDILVGADVLKGRTDIDIRGASEAVAQQFQ